MSSDGRFIPKGYILKPRIISESWVAHAPPVVRETWDWLLTNANHAPARYNGFDLARGQKFCTYKDIRDGLHWQVGYRIQRYSEDQMKGAMKLLRTHHMITTTKTPRGMLITICNYNKYQTPGNYEATHEDPNEATNEPPGRRAPPLSINKKEKNDKNEKNGRQIQMVFDYWQSVMAKPRAKLTDERKRKVLARLDNGYTVEDIKQAIDGCAKSEHHMGINKTGTVYDDLELICRDGKHLENFRDNIAKVIHQPDDLTSKNIRHAMETAL